MADMTVSKRSDSSTASTRRVEGNRRVISGTLTQPQAKYATGGFTVTPTSLGFDKEIEFLDVAPLDKEGKALVVAERKSGQEYLIKFFSAIGTQLANESETMKEKAVEFQAWGK